MVGNSYSWDSFDGAHSYLRLVRLILLAIGVEADQLIREHNQSDEAANTDYGKYFETDAKVLTQKRKAQSWPATGNLVPH